VVARRDSGVRVKSEGDYVNLVSSGDESEPSGRAVGMRSAQPAPADVRMCAIQERHADAVFRFLLRLAHGDRPLAEDLLQETLLRAWRTIDELPDDPESQRRWLFTAARRIAIDAARARRARPAEVQVTDLARIPAVRDEVEAVVAAHTVHRALPKLTPSHRQVLIELYFHVHSTEEAATRLGIPEGTVKSRAHYALRSLRAAIGVVDDAA
jgi:RNA polymerase sigma-70 factor (ECF subfamily)